MKPEQSNNNLLVFMLFILALEAIFFSVGNLQLKEKDRQKSERNANTEIALENLPIVAKAVSVYDINESRKIYGENDTEALPIASLAKIMTVVLALNNNSNNLNETVVITDDAINQDGEYGFFAGEEWKTKDLGKITLINSANDGAYALAFSRGDNEEKRDKFLEEMNSKARKVGMEDTFFLNVTGLDLEDTKVGAFASAEDVNIMMMYAFRAYPEVFTSTIFPEIKITSASGFTHSFKNTNTIVNKIPNIIFSKTGYTDLAGGSLSIIFKNKSGHDIAVTLLGSTFDGRFSDMESLVNILYNL